MVNLFTARIQGLPRDTMSGGGPRKEQQKLFAFLGGASTGVGDGGSAQRTIGPRARREMEDAVTSLAQKYFAGLFQVQDTKKVGAPSKDRIERERAVGVLLHTNCPLTEGDGEEEVEEDGRLGVMDESAILSEYTNNPYVELFPLE